MQVVLAFLLLPAAVHHRVPHDHVLVEPHRDVQGDIRDTGLAIAQLEVEGRGTVDAPAAYYDHVTRFQGTKQIPGKGSQHFLFSLVRSWPTATEVAKKLKSLPVGWTIAAAAFLSVRLDLCNQLFKLANGIRHRQRCGWEI